MKQFQAVMVGVGTVVLVAAMATQTLAAKEVIADEELDQVTAAGQPKVSQSYTGSGESRSTNFQVNVFAAHIGGQEELTALTLNNIFGENQVANGVNVQSGGANEGLQLNSIVQSWGSAMAQKAVKVDGAPGGPAACGASGIIAKCNATGGDASEGKIGILWSFADEISKASNDDGPATAANVVVNIFAGSFDEFAQSGLTALTVNNIIGFNQVANGVNISAGGISSTGIAGATSGSSSGQSNVIEQFRGAPKGWNEAPTFF